MRAMLLAAAVLSAGCVTQGYDGATRPAAELAVVRGDPPITAGLPVQVSLRQVDGVPLPAGQWRASVLPGTHAFVVDCRVADGKASRHVVEAEVFAGSRYRLVAEATAVACQQVSLVAD